jgi:tetratricopeptide (TPR) repeat protein
LKARSSNPARTAPARRRFFALIALLLPLLFLLAVELALRLLGHGHETAFFLEAKRGDETVLIDNAKFGWRFFPAAVARTPEPVAVPARKAPGVCRVFVFGESAAMGDPDPAVGLPRMLQAMLETRFPGRRFEVVNAAMTAINSHVVREIARECAGLEGDVWVIYMGNNEVVGPFGGGTVFGPQAPSLRAVRFAVWLKRTRIGQWLAGLQKPALTEWEGMEMFLRQQVRHDSPRLKTVHAHFAENLRDIIQAGVNSGAQVVLSTVAVNLRDSPPFASQHLHPPDAATSNEWRTLYLRGLEAAQAGKAADALAVFEKARALGSNDTHAALRFQIARAAEAAGMTRLAAAQFNAAREFDTLRFRADDAINAAIRAHSNAPGVTLVDAAGLLGARCSNGIAGAEVFHEHVHFNFDGNFALARALFDAVVPRLPAAIREQARAAEPTRADCARRLGWNEWKERGVLEEVRKRLQQPPFSTQFDAARRDAELAARIDALSLRLTPERLREIATDYHAAIARAPEDWVLREDAAKLLAELGDHAAAIGQWQAVAKLLPHDAQPEFHLGNLVEASGRAKEATGHFRSALRLKPDMVEARNGLALLLAADGDATGARREWELALRQKPRFSEGRVNYGQFLGSLGDTTGARREYERALRDNPNSSAAHVNLGKLLSAAGDKTAAAVHYRAALRIDSRHAIAHFNLGNVLLATAPEEAAGHYRAATTFKPDFAEARHALAMELARQGKIEDAIGQFAELVRQRPAMVEARFNHGVALAKARRFDEAAREFSETLRLEPGHARAREFLDKARALR